MPREQTQMAVVTATPVPPGSTQVHSSPESFLGAEQEGALMRLFQVGEGSTLPLVCWWPLS